MMPCNMLPEELSVTILRVPVVQTLQMEAVSSLETNRLGVIYQKI